MKPLILSFVLLTVFTTIQAQTNFKTGTVNTKNYTYQIKVNDGFRESKYVTFMNANNKLNRPSPTTQPLINEYATRDAIDPKFDFDAAAEIIKGVIGKDPFYQLANNTHNYLDINFKFGQDGSVKEMVFAIPADLPFTPQMIDNIETAMKGKILVKFDQRIIKNYGVPAYKLFQWISYSFIINFSKYQVK